MKPVLIDWNYIWENDVVVEFLTSLIAIKVVKKISFDYKGLRLEVFRMESEELEY